MSENLLIIDTAAIINLFAQRGQAGWDALFNTNKRVVVLEIMVEELGTAVDNAITKHNAKLPADLPKLFEEWLDANSTKARGAIRVPYTAVPESAYRNPINRNLIKDAGDDFIKNFIEGTDADALAARRASGIGSDAKFRVLTDDMNFVKKLVSDKGKFTTGFRQ